MAHIDNQGAQVHATWTHEGTLSAEHALAELVSEFVVLSAPEGVVYFADIEIRELTCRASGRAAAAPDAFPIGGNLLKQAVRLAQVSLAQVERARLFYCKSEIVHFLFFLFVQSPHIALRLYGGYLQLRAFRLFEAVCGFFCYYRAC